MTTTLAASSGCERRVGGVRHPTRLNVLVATVVTCVVLLGGAVGVLWCRDAGFQVSLERPWKLAYYTPTSIKLIDPSPMAAFHEWSEAGSEVHVGPVTVRWPASLMNGDRRGQWTRTLQHRANHELFETMEMRAATISYGQLVAAPDRYLSQHDISFRHFDARGRQARAYAALGEYRAAVWAARWKQPNEICNSIYCTESRFTDLGAYIRATMWARVAALGSSVEKEFRAALSRDSSGFFGGRPANAERYLDDLARPEIRLTLAELLLRERRVNEADILLRQILGTKSEVDPDTLRLARAYLAHPKALAASQNTGARR